MQTNELYFQEIETELFENHNKDYDVIEIMRDDEFLNVIFQEYGKEDEGRVLPAVRRYLPRTTDKPEFLREVIGFAVDWAQTEIGKDILNEFGSHLNKKSMLDNIAMYAIQEDNIAFASMVTDFIPEAKNKDDYLISLATDVHFLTDGDYKQGVKLFEQNFGADYFWSSLTVSAAKESLTGVFKKAMDKAFPLSEDKESFIAELLEISSSNKNNEIFRYLSKEFLPQLKNPEAAWGKIESNKGYKLSTNKYYALVNSSRQRDN